MSVAPSLTEIQEAAASLSGRIVETPTLLLNSQRFEPYLPANSTVHMKLELFQQAGSFKARGVLLATDALDAEQRARGVTAVSAGNHALAVAWGANKAGLSAKVVMPETADRVRVEGCQNLGAEVVLVANVGTAFEEMDRLVREEGRTMLHPFESPFMTLGAATCGAEIANAVPDLDVMLVPVGGGGLISGMAPAIRQIIPGCEIIGVEPYGADSMWQSLQKGEPVELERVDTIADSLGAPMSLPDTFALTKENVSEIVRLNDDDLRKAAKVLFDAMKIIAEPACAATFAAATGLLKKRLEGKKVGIIACGSNISLEKFNRIIAT